MLHDIHDQEYHCVDSWQMDDGGKGRSGSTATASGHEMGVVCALQNIKTQGVYVVVAPLSTKHDGLVVYHIWKM